MFTQAKSPNDDTMRDFKYDISYICNLSETKLPYVKLKLPRHIF